MPSQFGPDQDAPSQSPGPFMPMPQSWRLLSIAHSAVRSSAWLQAVISMNLEFSRVAGQSAHGFHLTPGAGAFWMQEMSVPSSLSAQTCAASLLAVREAVSFFSPCGALFQFGPCHLPQSPPGRVCSMNQSWRFMSSTHSITGPSNAMFEAASS